MNLQSLSENIAKEVPLSHSQGDQFLDVLYSEISRKLSEGEKVEIDGLGTFLTVKYPSRQYEDPPGSGKFSITMPTVLPEFEPHPVLVRKVTKAIIEHPEQFAQQEPETETDDGADEEPNSKKINLGNKAQPQEAELESENESSIAKSIELPDIESVKKVSKASDINYVDVSHMLVEKDILAMIPESISRKYSLAPIDLNEGVLTVAMIDPEDFDALQIIRKESGLEVKPVLTSKDDLSGVLDQYTGLQAELQEVIDHSDLGISKQELEDASQEDIQDQTNENAPTAKIVFSLLKRAVKEKASDIHIEPREHKVIVRFRIDGILQSRVELPKEIQSAVISRLKILANLKIDEQRLPQDGRLDLIIDHRQIDFRLSTMPVVFGEKVVMRILDKSVGIISLEEVGLSDQGLDVLNKNMKRSHGMILVTGPTGSGKTTSLYAVLGRLMDDSLNILTLEDPVEYRIETINQSQVHAEIGYSFAAGLRAVVRQDPDVVMLGEIRDQETADMAIHAALTGHIVLSTLHTNDSAGAFPRLIDMKIEPFLITSSVHTVIAQRLTRKVCQNCLEEVKYEKEAIKEIEVEIAKMHENVRKDIAKMPLKFYRGKGCDSCGDKGYKGRLGVFEVLNVTEPIRELVLKRSSGEEVAAQARKEGMVTMVQDGIVKALRGLTTMEEVWRVTRE